MRTHQPAWLWISTVALAMGVGYGAGAHFGGGRGQEPVQQPPPLTSETALPEDDPLPPAVEDWGDEVSPGVYVLRSLEPPQIEDDDDLRARLRCFLEPPGVVAARVYAPDDPDDPFWPKGPIDVYLVYNHADMRSQLHGIMWFGPDDNPSEVGSHLIYSLHLGNCYGLMFLDVDGDGRREVITTSPGADQYSLAIVDLFAPGGPDRKSGGLPFTNSEWWKFADLDDDGVYEAITEGPAWDVKNEVRDGENEQRVFAVYSLSGDEWSLSSVHEDDPTVQQ